MSRISTVETSLQ
jgi:hypothetical protein